LKTTPEDDFGVQLLRFREARKHMNCHVWPLHEQYHLLYVPSKKYTTYSAGAVGGGAHRYDIRPPGKSNGADVREGGKNSRIWGQIWSEAE